MRVYVESVGKPWKATPESDPLFTLTIGGQTEPCKTYDTALTTVGWHEAETFKSKSGKEYWRTPKAGVSVSAEASSRGEHGGQQPASKWQPKDEAGIKAMWSISQAIALQGEGSGLDVVEAVASDLFAMVDRVKQGTPEVTKVDRGDFASVELPPIEAYEE